MNKPSKALACSFLSIFLISSCAMVRQQDLDAWKDVPVSALDTHSLFLTIPMVKTFSANGTEIRNYVNGQNVASCYASGSGSGNANAFSSGNFVNAISTNSFSAFQNCTSQFIACNNIFYIRKGRVVEYKPSGHCFTDTRVQPENGWQNR